MAHRKLLIHIGLHKTGTSAIQAFLKENRPDLLRQGILYPLDLEEWRNHNPLVWHLLDSKYLPENRDYYLGQASPEHWAVLRRTIEESDAPRVILSGEDFCLTEPERLADLCVRYDTNVLVYLRRQDQYVQSIYGEDVKSFRYMRRQSFEEFLERHRLMDIVHYDRFLRRWADSFGKENMTVGIYDKARMKGGLIEDFASKACINLDGCTKRSPGEVNGSISGSLLEAKRLLNRFHFTDRQHRFLLESLLRTPMARNQQKTVLSEHTLMTRERRDAFLEQFQEGNREVAREFFGSDSALFSDPEDDPAPAGGSAAALPDSRTLLLDLLGPMLQDMTSRLAAASIPERPDIPVDRARKALEADAPEVSFRKDALTTESAALFGLPASAQDNSNLYSMVNWAPVYIPLLDAVSPSCIVEIGSEYGGNTRCLGRYCIDRGIRLHVVDTHPTINPELEQSPLIHYHRSRSVDFLKEFGGAEVYFIDGDHNYATVSAELSYIAKAHDGGKPVLLLVHDTGWPYGIVDCFYDPSTVDGEIPPLSSAAGPLPWKATLDESGFWKGAVSYSMKIGGARNGLRAAIEDFAGNNVGWRKAYFTPFYGLCFLWKEDSLPDALSDYLEDLLDALSRAEPIFATLEWNRVLLYLQTQFMGSEWNKLQAAISELMREKARQLDEISRAGTIWKEQRSWIEHLERRLRSAGVPF